MAIVLDVLTKLDERAIAATSGTIETEFVAVGLRAGEKMMGGIHDAFSTINFAEEIEGWADMTAVEQVGSAMGAQMGQAIGAGLRLALAGGVAAIGLTAIAAEIGEQFENINRQIEVHSAASGEALEGLKQHADALVGSLDTSTKQVGSDMAQLATRLNMEAGGALDQLTQHVEMLRDRFGDLNTDQLTAGMSQFNVTGAQADQTLASLVNSAREFDVPLQTLIANTSSLGITLHEAGLNMEQSGHFLAQLSANGVPAQQAVMGLEASMKAAQKTGQDFPTFVRNLATSLEYYKRTGQTEMAEQVAFDVAGSRRWAQLLAAANAYNETVRAGAGAYEGQSQQLDELGRKTQTFHNLWQELRNHIDAALAPQGQTVVDVVGGKMNELIAFVDAHKDGLREMFETGINAAEHLAETLAKVGEFLAQHPGLIQAVVTAFGAWEAIRGVNMVLTTLELIKTALSVEVPAAAAAGATEVEAAAGGMAAAFGPVATVLAGIAATIAVVARNIKEIQHPENHPDWPHMLLGSAADLFGPDHGGAQPTPPAPTAGGTPRPPGFIGPVAPGAPGITRAGPTLPGPQPGAPDWYHQTYGGGGQPPPGGPPADDTGAPGTPGAGGGSPFDGVPDGLLTPQQLEEKKKGAKGPRLPAAPQIPYGPEYSAPPQAGESEQHYSARGNVLEAEHTLAEKRARVEQLEKTTTATAEDVTNARNAVAEAERKVNEARGRLTNEEQSEREKELRALLGHGRRLREAGSEFEQVGAKLDQDLGVSKGLAGIADNLTKFLANMAMAPVYGQLMAQQAATGGGLGVPKGAGGLVGMAALGGAFGPQYTPQGLIASGSYGQGLLGGDAQGGLGGALGALGAGSALGYSGLGALGGGRGLGAFLQPGANVLTGPHTENTGGALVPRAAALKNMIGQMFGVTDIGGYRQPDGYNEHSSGEALDIMVHDNKALGDQINQYLQANAASLGLQYTLWQQQEWDPGRPPSGMPNRGSPTENHMDHVHARLLPGAIPGGGAGAGLGALGALGGLGGLDPSAIMGGDGASLGGLGAGLGDSPAVAPSGFAGGGGPTTGPQQAAYNAMIQAGYPPSEWPALKNILDRESGGGDPNARNPSSGAFGMYQFLGHQNDKYGQLGGYSPDPAQQSVAGMAYIRDRYGTPSAAWSHWQQAGSYDDGGQVTHWRGDRVPYISHDRIPAQATNPHVQTDLPGMVDTPGGGVAVPIVAHEGEHVFTRRDVSAMGGHNAVYQFRNALHYDEGGEVHQGSGAAPGPTKIGGAEPWAGIGSGIPGGSGGGAGGGFAAGMAAGAGSMGIGLAAQIAMQEAQRAIQFAGQVAGIGIEGLQQTFIPTGGSQLAANSWLARIAGAVVGAKPALPNLAGKAPTPVPGAGALGGARMPLTPEAILGPAAASAGGAPSGPGPLPGPAGRSQHLGTGAPPGPGGAGDYTGVHIEHFHAGDRSDTAVASEIARHDVAKYDVGPLTGRR